MSFWENKYIKSARKQHKCYYCDRTIQKGEAYQHCAGTYEGEFQYYNLCDRCTVVVDEIQESGELSDFFEMIINNGYILCPECNGDNLREYDFTEDGLYLDCECDECDHKWREDLTVAGIKNILGVVEPPEI